MVKKFIMVGQGASFNLALKYDGHWVIVGGHGRLEEIIGSVFSEFFKLEKPKVIWTQKNKVRYVASCSSRQWESGLKKMKEEGITFEERKELGRIMR